MPVEKEPKPKKAFEIKVVVWDDGEIDTELYEFRENPSGRGAPGKWRQNKTDFTRRIQETLADPAILLTDVYEKIGGVEQAPSEVSQTTPNADFKVVNQSQTESSISTDITSPSEDPDESSIEFGDFDTNVDTPDKDK
jgi:hypothetical protein